MAERQMIYLVFCHPIPSHPSVTPSSALLATTLNCKLKWVVMPKCSADRHRDSIIRGMLAKNYMLAICKGFLNRRSDEGQMNIV